MEIKSVQNTLLQIVEAAGENGVTDEQVANEIVKKHRMSHFEAMEASQEINKNLGTKVVLEYGKGVFTYRKPKQPEQPAQKKPEESAAVRLAKKLGKQNMGDKGRMEIMKHYTR